MARRRLASPFLTTVATAATLLAGCGTNVVFEGSDGGGGQATTTGQGGSGAQGGTAQGGTGGGQTPCPALMPAHGSPCSGSISCDYDVDCNGVTATCNGSTWELYTEPYECNPPPCPADKPVDGSSCAGFLEGQACEYLSEWPCPEIPVFATCDGNAWNVDEPLCNPPPPLPCRDYTDANLCQGDPSCRWIVPGCGPNPLDDAQCFPIVGCDQDPFSCTDAEICVEISHHPCWNSTCQACDTPVHVCLGDDSDV